MRSFHDLTKLLCTLLLLMLCVTEGAQGVSLRGWMRRAIERSHGSSRSSGGDDMDGMMNRRRKSDGEVEEVVHERRRLQAAAYCVAEAGADATKLQDALDWACGSGTNGGNVDCSAILQTGSCYNPDTLQAHASYAFNYYYVKEGGATGSCDFNGLATTVTTDPSSGSCVYPSLSSGVGASTSNGTNIVSPSSNNTSFGSPTTTTGTTSNASSLTFSLLVLIFLMVSPSFLYTNL